MSTRVKVKLEFEWNGDPLPFHVGDNINEFIIAGIAAISPPIRGETTVGELMAGAKLLLTYPKATRYLKAQVKP